MSSINIIKKQSINDLIVEKVIDILIKVKALINGINMYKRFNPNSTRMKQYNHINCNYTPEDCGYSLRNFKLNIIEVSLQIHNLKNRHIGI